MRSIITDRLMFRTRKFYCDLYKFEWMLGIASKEQWGKAQERFEDALDINRCRTSTGDACAIYPTHRKPFALLFRCVPETSVLAHEVMHATGHVMTVLGIPFNEDTAEAYCYLTEHLTEKACAWFRTLRK